MKQAMLLGAIAAIAHADMTPAKYNKLKSVSAASESVSLTILAFLNQLFV